MSRGVGEAPPRAGDRRGEQRVDAGQGHGAREEPVRSLSEGAAPLPQSKGHGGDDWWAPRGPAAAVCHLLCRCQVRARGRAAGSSRRRGGSCLGGACPPRPKPPAACHTHVCRDVRVARMCSRMPRRVPCSISARSEQLRHTSGREKTCVFPSSMCLEGKPALWPFLGQFDLSATGRLFPRQISDLARR